jgi:glucokinase
MVTNPQVAFLNSKVLLIDIGGTNIRTASAQVGSSELLNANKKNLNCLDSFEEMLQGFLDQDASLKHVVFSIAGPKLNNSISMTNREFKIDESEILKNFEIDSCHILNDWESIGHGLSLFKKMKCIPLMRVIHLIIQL